MLQFEHPCTRIWCCPCIRWHIQYEPCSSLPADSIISVNELLPPLCTALKLWVLPAPYRSTNHLFHALMHYTSYRKCKESNSSVWQFQNARNKGTLLELKHTPKAKWPLATPSSLLFSVINKKNPAPRSSRVRVRLHIKHFSSFHLHSFRRTSKQVPA